MSDTAPRAGGRPDADGADRADRADRAALSAVLEPGSALLADQVAACGATAVLAALRAGTSPLDRDGVRLAARANAVDGEDLLRRAAGTGVRLVCPGDHEWPATSEVLSTAGAHDRVGGPPPGLWVRGDGDLRGLMARAVAVVGARAATAYGTSVAVELGAELAERGWTVVSGAAYGIDASAHRGSLAVGGPTVAVLACGADVAYPRGNAELVERVAAEGLVVSELPPGAAPSRSRFLARNRLIAALTRGTVVVEAALRSGALSTAAWAERCGRPVMAVPGPVTSALSGGPHRWLRDQRAVLVTGAADVVDVVGVLGEDGSGEPRGPRRAWDDLPPAAAAVLEALPARSGAGLATVASRAGLTVSECLAGLGHLEMIDLAERQGEGWRVGPAVRAARG